MWPEIYTSECRKMQLRVFVKTKLSGCACPRNPVAKLRAYGAGAESRGVQICSILCIGQL